MKKILLLILLVVSFLGNAQEITGVVSDDDNLPLIGATVHLTNADLHTVTGLDGSFIFKNLTYGSYTIKVTYVGFQAYEYTLILKEDGNSTTKHNIKLKTDAQTLKAFEVVESARSGSISEARTTEKNALTVMNVTSAEAIKLSPDNSVSEVIQRVSGVTLESNNNGTGESFAIIRGMPKRYNYTLVNGIKIPSSDNKNRYVSLDLFPSDLLARLEVIKSLTPEMEGDAVGGAVNMVMKKAPEKTFLNVNAFAGYQAIYFDQPFRNYNASLTEAKSPFETEGPLYKATAEDFTTENRETTTTDFSPDYYIAVSGGKRFLKNKLGVLVTGTANRMHTGTEAVRFEPSISRDGESLPVLTNMKERFYYNDVTQYGVNGVIDYNLKKGHKFQLSALYVDLNNNQLREQTKTRLWGASPGEALVKTYSQRFRTTHRKIYNFTLSGEDKLSKSIKMDWKVAYSKARKDRPDHADFVTVSNYSLVQDQESILVAEDGDNNRAWEYNTDKDITAILNFTKDLKTDLNEYTFKVGMLSRFKSRNSFIVTYNFNPDPGIQAYGNNWVPDDSDVTNYGTWENYGDINFRLRNPQGSTRNELNNDSHQNIMAGYAQFSMKYHELFDLTTGVRVEQTDQGYTLLAPRAGQQESDNQEYIDVLPSLSIKYHLNKKGNLRLSYFYSIIRPGYFEIIPYFYRQEDYVEMGNTDLQKIRTHNIDLRYERYESSVGQILIGAFYKQINDPIEYVLTEGTDFGVNDIVRRPGNFGVANNLGLEVNYIKYVRSFGVKLNYSYTHSSVTTEKSLRKREIEGDESSSIVTVSQEQTRPLQGQAANIGNISLLYKGATNNINAQLAFTYTGERIRTVSNFYNNDEWEKPFYQLDFSIQKKFNTRWTVYLKVRNLLNSKYETFIKQPVNAENAEFPYQGNTGDDVITGQELVGRSFRLGVRIKL